MLTPEFNFFHCRWSVQIWDACGILEIIEPDWKGWLTSKEYGTTRDFAPSRRYMELESWKKRFNFCVFCGMFDCLGVFTLTFWHPGVPEVSRICMDLWNAFDCVTCRGTWRDRRDRWWTLQSWWSWPQMACPWWAPPGPPEPKRDPSSGPSDQSRWWRDQKSGSWVRNRRLWPSRCGDHWRVSPAASKSVLCPSTCSWKAKLLRWGVYLVILGTFDCDSRQPKTNKLFTYKVLLEEE